MRVLSGIQPTGRSHWGNYFGAIRQYIDLQNDRRGVLLHRQSARADHGPRSRELLASTRSTRPSTCWPWGSIRDRATLFVQSDVPEVSELCWLLMTGTPMGLLERCHAYKDKKAKGLPADAGLFTYPVLMAADILVYDSDTVPVGEDQVQHIEVCRDLAGSFNHQFGETFVMPKAKVLDASAKVPGTDGEKMSKSYNNTLEIFEDPKAQRKKIMRIVTDSRPDGAAEGAGHRPLFQLYSLFADDRRARGDGRPVSPRRLRLRRGEEGAGRRGRALLCRAALRGGPNWPPNPDRGARDPGRRRARGPQEGRPGARASQESLRADDPVSEQCHAPSAR